MQHWHFDLSWQAEQTFDELTMDGMSLTMMSTVLGMDLFSAQANRLTETVARLVNCGV